MTEDMAPFSSGPTCTKCHEPCDAEQPAPFKVGDTIRCKHNEVTAAIVGVSAQGVDYVHEPRVYRVAGVTGHSCSGTVFPNGYDNWEVVNTQREEAKTE
jgi:hypothetical protein